jgi:dienelactone hydrolase
MTPAVCALVLSFAFADADPARVLPPGEKPADHRLGKPRTLNDKDFFFTPPTDLKAWDARRRELREQILVATGLWPLPAKTPLNPVIHGKIERDGYTVEKVFFASLPGHYVSGNLYRPMGKTGRLPAVLSPHGHWANGRFFDAGEKEGQKQIDQKAEKTMEGARYPLQARCAQLARMGCVVFHYDMVGNADSTAIGHRLGFTDADAELRLQSFMGLQTWNSIRALDFLLSLPDVDPKRVGVTGASGGGTQTFMLCAVDDRPAAAFPAVMVSTAMQGGCVCENCSYLRQGTGNVEIAALFAPKPLGMSAANDWTVDMETKGLPELKKLYQLYEAEDKVMAKCHPEFGHNYNQVSREIMYNWFNKHLNLGFSSPVSEQPFEPIPPKQLSVYNDDHPRPKDTADAERVRQYMSETSDAQIKTLLPKDAKGLAEYRRVMGTALRVMIGEHSTRPVVEAQEVGAKETIDDVTRTKLLLSRKGSGEQVPTLLLRGKDFDGTIVVWIHPDGKAGLFGDGKLTADVRRALAGKAAVLAVDAFGTGELKIDKPVVDGAFAGYTFGYNRPLLANRVHDILTAVVYARSLERVKAVHLLGEGKAGPWVLLARGLCGADLVNRTAADVNEFRYEKVRTITDEMMLPGALKYDGLSALAALAAPGELYFHNYHGTGSGPWMKGVYAAAGATDKLKRVSEKEPTAKVVEWLLR